MEAAGCEGESGLSLLARLADRPALTNFFAAGQPGPCHRLTPVFVVSGESDNKDSNSGGKHFPVGSTPAVLAHFFKHLVCNVILPVRWRGVEFAGCGAGVVLLNCDHHLKVKEVAEELEGRVRKIAEQHYRNLPHNRRKTDRLTSSDQWSIVKESLERLLVMDIFTPDSLEVSLIGLRNIILGNNNISCILVTSINTFYHQVRAQTGIFHTAYIRKLLTHLLTSAQVANDSLKIVFSQLQLFKTPDNNLYSVRNPRDQLAVIKDRIQLERGEDCAAPSEYTVKYNSIKLRALYQ